MEEAGLLAGLLILKQQSWLRLRRRPPEFIKKPTYLEESDAEESIVGKMPPAEDSDSSE